MKNDFSEFLKELDHGRVAQQCTERLRKLVKAVQETGSPGKLTLTLTVTKEQVRAAVVPKLDVKEPMEKMAGSLFFFDMKEEGGLVREDPRQLKLKELPERKTKDEVN